MPGQITEHLSSKLNIGLAYPADQTGPIVTRSAAQSFLRYPLTQVLGTEANVRLLRELSLYGGQLSAPSLVSRTGLAKGSVHAGLARLTQLGALLVRGSGHSQLYALRADYLLRGTIEALFEAERARFDAVQDAIRLAAKECRPPIVAAYVYGSVARGQDQPGSDLDILVVVGNGDEAPPAAAAMRDALRGPGERIGFSPSVIGLGVEDMMPMLRDDRSPWGTALREALVVLGRSPSSLARPRPPARTARPA